MPILDRQQLEESPLADLHAIASELGIEGFRRLRREELIETLLAAEGGEGASGEGEAKAEAAVEEADEEAEAEEAQAQEEAEPARRGEEEPAPEPEPEEEEEDVRSGVLDVLPNGSGFMRPDPFAHSRDDVYV